MARQARSKQKSSVFSIKQKTHQDLFRDKEDRQQFVNILQSAKEVYGLDIYAYCLLDANEFWLIINAKHRNISAIMQSITIQYALYRDDVEKLFSTRYHSIPIHSVERLEQEVVELKSDSRYANCAYCFYSPIDMMPYPFISELDDKIEIQTKHLGKLSDYDFVRVVDKEVIKIEKENVQERNQLIQQIYANHNVTQKQIADYFDISSSAVSKILKQGA